VSSALAAARTLGCPAARDAVFRAARTSAIFLSSRPVGGRAAGVTSDPQRGARTAPQSPRALGAPQDTGFRLPIGSDRLLRRRGQLKTCRAPRPSAAYGRPDRLLRLPGGQCRARWRGPREATGAVCHQSVRCGRRFFARPGEGFVVTAPASTFEASGFGHHSLADKTWGWCADSFRVRSPSQQVMQRGRRAQADRDLVIKAALTSVVAAIATASHRSLRTRRCASSPRNRSEGDARCKSGNSS
jgi:hypothetical protein